MKNVVETKSDSDGGMIKVLQVVESVSMLMMLGVLLWTYRDAVKELFTGGYNPYLYFHTFMSMMILVPSVAATICGIYAMPELFWIVTCEQWYIVIRIAQEFG